MRRPDRFVRDVTATMMALAVLVASAPAFAGDCDRVQGALSRGAEAADVAADLDLSIDEVVRCWAATEGGDGEVAAEIERQERARATPAPAATPE